MVNEKGAGDGWLILDFRRLVELLLPNLSPFDGLRVGTVGHDDAS